MRFQSRVTRFLILLVVLAVGVAMGGCAKKILTPEEQRQIEFAGAPGWVIDDCDSFWADDDGARLCAVGDATIGQNRSIADIKASSRARTSISRALENGLNDMIADYRQQVADGPSEMTDEGFSSTIVSLAKSILNSTSIQTTWDSPGGRLYLLVALEVESFETSVRENDEISSGLRSFMESGARKLFTAPGDENQVE